MSKRARGPVAPQPPRVTVRPQDRFKFRTPSLRNVALTGQWGHAGAYTTLEAVVRHHIDPVASLESYRPDEIELPPLGRVIAGAPVACVATVVLARAVCGIAMA